MTDGLSALIVLRGGLFEQRWANNEGFFGVGRRYETRTINSTCELLCKEGARWWYVQILPSVASIAWIVEKGKVYESMW